MIEQTADRDPRRGLRIGDTEPGQVALHWRIQVHLARLDQLYYGQGGEGLADGTDDEGCLWCHRTPGGICLAISFEINDLIAFDNGDREPWNMRRLHPGG